MEYYNPTCLTLVVFSQLLLATCFLKIWLCTHFYAACLFWKKSILVNVPTSRISNEIPLMLHILISRKFQVSSYLILHTVGLALLLLKSYYFSSLMFVFSYYLINSFTVLVVFTTAMISSSMAYYLLLIVLLLTVQWIFEFPCLTIFDLLMYVGPLVA